MATTFEVRLGKTTVVAPEFPATEQFWLPLSNLDLLLPPNDFAIFFCFEKPPPDSAAADVSIVKALKKSLSKTLVSYYAFAGQTVKNGAGEPEILCNGRGVDFVEAYADVELRELDLYRPDETVEGKLVSKRKNNGVLIVQATLLKCGGVVVGCTFDHQVSDAYTANIFLESWAAVAQSKPATTVPLFRRSLLAPRRPIRSDPSLEQTYIRLSQMPQPPKGFVYTPPSPISRIYSIAADKVRHLQKSANAGKNGSRTKNEAFSAYLWQLIAAGTAETAAEHDANNFCRLGLCVDGRARIIAGKEDSSSMARYFGNVVAIPFGEKRIPELSEMPLSAVADEVHRFVETADDEHFRGLIDYVEAHLPEPIFARIYVARKEEPAVLVSSGTRFPVAKLDFGWGPPVFGSYHFSWKAEAGYVMPMPHPSGNGDWVVFMLMTKEMIAIVEKNGSDVLKPYKLC